MNDKFLFKTIPLSYASTPAEVKAFMKHLVEQHSFWVGLKKEESNKLRQTADD